MRALCLAGLLGGGLVCLASSARAASSIIHCTAAGETPQDIARGYGISLAALRKSSGTIRRFMAAAKTQRRKKGRKKPPPPKLKAHQRVRIHRPRRQPETRHMALRISRGASLAWVSRTWHAPVGLLRCLNDLGPKVIRVRAPAKRGQNKAGSDARTARRRLLIVPIDIPATKARPSGTPNRGGLRMAERLPEAPGLFVRSPGESWGANHLITAILRAISAVNQSFADTHLLVVGHLSHRGGGHLTPHKSHQNGLDADIGYYFRTEVPHDRFTVAHRRNLDARRTWAFLRALLDSQEVQYIFIDTPIQRLLRAHAEADRGVTRRWCRSWMVARRRARAQAGQPGLSRPAKGRRSCLDTIFEASRHGSNPTALIRRAKGHDDHMHLRVLPRAR